MLLITELLLTLVASNTDAPVGATSAARRANRADDMTDDMADDVGARLRFVARRPPTRYASLPRKNI